MLLALASLAREGGSFFGQSPKNEPLSPPFASEASAMINVSTKIVKQLFF
ncbi:MAG: hypothetical protein U5L45_16900 [Saprospiraceae bacterium]|nr:hypothetical protein [Saprospiraceae bacterium]